MNAARKEEVTSRGMILVVVLWATALMTVIVVALSAYSQKNVSLAGIEADRLRTGMALQAGVDVGEAMILARTSSDRVFFDGSPATADVGDGRLVEIAIMDAAGLVDINRAKRELIESLAARLDPSGGAVASIAEEIMKLREAHRPKNSSQQEPQRNEPSANQEASQPTPVAEFFSTSQLYGLQGATAEAADKLLPFVSLYSADGKVNPMAAPEIVMQSIPGLRLSEVGTLAAARKLRQWNSPEVQNILSQHPDFLAVVESRIFVLDVRVVSGRGVIAGSLLQATVALNETGNPPFQVLAWSW